MQGFQVRRRGTPAEERIAALVDEGDPAARLGEDDAERELADAVHRIHDDAQPGFADGVQIDQFFDGVHVLVGHVAPPDDPGFERQAEFELDHFGGGQAVGLGGDGARLFVQEQRPVAAEDFQAVPFRRVVAGGEDQAVGRIKKRRGVGDQRGGDVFREQGDGNVVSGEDLGGRLGGPVREEAPVVTDQHAALFLLLAGDLVGERLREPPHVVQGEAFADDGAPAAGPEGHLAFGLRAVRAEEPFLQDEPGFGQVLGGVDALHFVLVVGLIALHQHPGADQLVDAIGEAVASGF